MKLLPLFLALGLLFTARDNEYTPKVAKKNQTTLAGPPTIVGKLADGRAVGRYHIDRPNDNDHYIYIVGDVITLNTTVQQGRITIPQVTVVIDGKNYFLTPAGNE